MVFWLAGLPIDCLIEELMRCMLAWVTVFFILIACGTDCVANRSVINNTCATKDWWSCIAFPQFYRSNICAASLLLQIAACCWRWLPTSLHLALAGSPALASRGRKSPSWNRFHRCWYRSKASRFPINVSIADFNMSGVVLLEESLLFEVWRVSLHSFFLHNM